MDISPSLVKELREKTSAGMMDCKKALAETSGDMEKAIDFLRKQGLSTAAKKAGRVAADGTIGFTIDDKGSFGAMVEVNCETDFVTKTDGFQQYVKELTEVLRLNNVADIDALMAASVKGSTMREVQTALVVKIGENLGARRFVRWQSNGAGQKIAQYIHAGNKIGVMVRFTDPTDKLAMTLAREVAMHVAAMNPSYVRKEDIPESVLAKEKEIMLAQMGDMKKPPEIMDKIAAGKVAKYVNDVCLDNQIFVRDPEGKTTVAQVLATIDQGIRIEEFVRLQVGEGIEKKQEA